MGIAIGEVFGTGDAGGQPEKVPTGARGAQRKRNSECRSGAWRKEL